VGPASLKICAANAVGPCLLALKQLPSLRTHDFRWQAVKVTGAAAGDPDDMDTLFVTLAADGQVLTMLFECESWAEIVGACDTMQHSFQQQLEAHTVRQRVIV
jgi:hypothetical protein